MKVSPVLGATPKRDLRCEFLVWAPAAERVEVEFWTSGGEAKAALRKIERGYFHAVVEGIGPGSRYFYLLDGEKRRADPASRFQPEGVHGPSEVSGQAFAWSDASWRGLELRDYIIYELHTGLFTSEGNFDGVIGRLDDLKRLGVTVIELMPVAQFPGERNWGYDGTFPFAVQNSYGGPQGLKRLVDACHRLGLAVALDVVYNHLGPEGNYLGDFGPYFTDRYRTPWGMALNFDGEGSEEVRRYFIENALYWIEGFHIDALRLDALHAIVDRSASPFFSHLSQAVHARAKLLNRRVYLIGEDDLNEARMIQARDKGGYGLDALWNDDFHHALHTVLTGERRGYYCDFGRLGQLAKAFRQGFVYAGDYSGYRRRRQGSSLKGVEPARLVVFAQNHDQVGNRFLGERLSSLVSFEALKAAAAAVILSPFTPLLFMGEEYGERAPFRYFVSHTDPGLIEAVRRGRLAEFSAFGLEGEAVDPQSEAAYLAGKLHAELAREGSHKVLLGFYTHLLRLRKSILSSSRVREVLSSGTQKVLLVRLSGKQEALALFHFNGTEGCADLEWPSGRWRKILDSADKSWGGGGSRIPEVLGKSSRASLCFEPYSFAFFVELKTL